MDKRFAPALLIAAAFASNAFAATGNMVVFDDTDEDWFDHAGALCTGQILYAETIVVHSGSAAVGVSRNSDNNGVGWVTPIVYSATDDYDGISFWVNAGSDQTTLTSLAIYDADAVPHFLHLEDVYGGPLPANTWVPFQIPFSSSFFAAALSTSPATIQTICLINHSGGGGPSAFFYVDDVALIGADIFKSGFEN